jgi:hypothetical protein
MKKYLTWHPLGKPGAFISKKDYDVVRDFILSTLMSEEMTLMDLIALGERNLAGQIEENIAWHILVVKLDLEARGVIFSFLKLAPYKSQFIKLKRKASKGLNNIYHNTTGDDQQSPNADRSR